MKFSAVNPCQSPPRAPRTKPCHSATTAAHDRRRECCHRAEDLGKGSQFYLGYISRARDRYVRTPTNRHIAYGYNNFLKLASKPQKIAVTYSERIKNGIFCIIRGIENIGIPVFRYSSPKTVHSFFSGYPRTNRLFGLQNIRFVPFGCRAKAFAVPTAPDVSVFHHPLLLY